jgi:hypothetical protein
MTVQDISQEYDFTNDSTEVRSINSQVDGGADFDSYFIAQQDGEIIGAYGMYGVIPYNNKTVYSVGHLLP